MRLLSALALLFACGGTPPLGGGGAGTSAEQTARGDGGSKEIRFENCAQRRCMQHPGTKTFHECHNAVGDKCFQFGRPCEQTGSK